MRAVPVSRKDHGSVLATANDVDDSSSRSSESSFADPSENDLNMWQGAALLTADCLGTGLLALPQDIQVLGRAVGLGFLLLNLPINLYAGTILNYAAGQVEQEQQIKDDENDNDATPDTIAVPTKKSRRRQDGDGLVRVGRSHKYSTIDNTVSSNVDNDNNNNADGGPSTMNGDQQHKVSDRISESKDRPVEELQTSNEQHHHHSDSSTYDFIGMTRELFPYRRQATLIVMGVYYTNLFLVLGDYILVMSHAVAAMVEERLCLPTAGVVASTLMFAVSQLRTMANLGRSAAIVSLISLALVIFQCLIAARHKDTNATDGEPGVYIPPPDDVTLLRKLSALASIGFATGSQKLFLNIRHEMKHRQEAPKSLGLALSVFGFVYVGICLLAGPNPPSFLFDDIPNGWNRQVAGLLLWIHVAVSYAINSQAICSSVDRLCVHRITLGDLHLHPRRRWLLITLFLAVSSYLVANVVPFFKDLVALIGALTSVPLTLLLPALLYRRVIKVPLWLPTFDSMSSYSLMLFSLAFLGAGLAGSLSSIELDWSKHGPPFSCR